MGPLVIPAVIFGGLVIKSFSSPKVRKEPINPRSQEIFDAALLHLEDPVRLREVSEVFRSQGFTGHADVLAARANLFSSRREVKAQLEGLYQVALESQNPDAVHETADYLERHGALGAATDLRKYAQGLIVAITTPLPETPVEGARAATATRRQAPAPAPKAEEAEENAPRETVEKSEVTSVAPAEAHAKAKKAPKAGEGTIAGSVVPFSSPTAVVDVAEEKKEI